MTASYAGPRYWDSFFRRLREAGSDLDWEGRWIEPFLVPLRDGRVRTILELGCGTGNDAARLADEGYAVTALDFSGEAIERARSRFGSRVGFLVADMAAPLPFCAGGFDAVMSNVALHMFPDGVTRSLFAEIGRVVSPDGLFVFHVNARARKSSSGITCWSRQARRCTSSPMTTSKICSDRGARSDSNQSRSPTLARVNPSSRSGAVSRGDSLFSVSRPS
jgi:SAM-dependent methyltransferase